MVDYNISQALDVDAGMVVAARSVRGCWGVSVDPDECPDRSFDRKLDVDIPGLPTIRRIATAPETCFLKKDLTKRHGKF